MLVISIQQLNLLGFKVEQKVSGDLVITRPEARVYDRDHAVSIEETPAEIFQATVKEAVDKMFPRVHTSLIERAIERFEDALYASEISNAIMNTNEGIALDVIDQPTKKTFRP
jgi:hypothetical protein